MTEHTPPTAEQIINELVRDEQVKVHGFGGDVGANAVWRDGFEEGMTRLLAALRSSGVLPETPSAALDREELRLRIYEALSEEAAFNGEADAVVDVIWPLLGGLAGSEPSTDALIEQLGAELSTIDVWAYMVNADDGYGAAVRLRPRHYRDDERRSYGRGATARGALHEALLAAVSASQPKDV